MEIIGFHLVLLWIQLSSVLALDELRGLGKRDSDSIEEVVTDYATRYETVTSMITSVYTTTDLSTQTNVKSSSQVISGESIATESVINTDYTTVSSIDFITSTLTVPVNETLFTTYLTTSTQFFTEIDIVPLVETVVDTVFYTVTSDSMVETTNEITETVTDEITYTSVSLSTLTELPSSTVTHVFTTTGSTTIWSWITSTVVNDGVTTLITTETGVASTLTDLIVTETETLVDTNFSNPTFTFIEEVTDEVVSTITATFVSTYASPITVTESSLSTHETTVGSSEEPSTVVATVVSTITTENTIETHSVIYSDATTTLFDERPFEIEEIEEITMNVTTIVDHNHTDVSTVNSTETVTSVLTSIWTNTINDIVTGTGNARSKDQALETSFGKACPCATSTFSCNGKPSDCVVASEKYHKSMSSCCGHSMCTMAPGQQRPCGCGSNSTIAAGCRSSFVRSCNSTSNCATTATRSTVEGMYFCKGPTKTTYVTNGMTDTTTTCSTVWVTATSGNSVMADKGTFNNGTMCAAECSMGHGCSAGVCQPQSSRTMIAAVCTNPAQCMTQGTLMVSGHNDMTIVAAAATASDVMGRTSHTVSRFEGVGNSIGLSVGSVAIVVISFLFY